MEGRRQKGDRQVEIERNNGTFRRRDRQTQRKKETVRDERKGEGKIKRES